MAVFWKRLPDQFRRHVFVWCRFGDHEAVGKGIGFLRDTVRQDGSWPIDTNLASWVTSLRCACHGVIIYRIV